MDEQPSANGHEEQPVLTPEAVTNARGFGSGLGRATKLTPEIWTRLIEAVLAGNYFTAAAGYAGIKVDTFWYWMKRGKREPESEYGRFRAAVIEAEAKAEARVVAHWQQHMASDWKAARDFLARRFPDRWAAFRKMELTGRDGGPVVLTLDLGEGVGKKRGEGGQRSLPPAAEQAGLSGDDDDGEEWVDDEDGWEQDGDGADTGDEH